MRTKRFVQRMLRGRRVDCALLTEEQLKLYRLVWQRFVASQMTPAVFDVTTAKIAAVSAKTGKTYDFRVSGSVVRFDGFLKVTSFWKRRRTRTTSRATSCPTWTT